MERRLLEKRQPKVLYQKYTVKFGYWMKHGITILNAGISKLKIKGWESKRGREWESKRGRENSIGTCDKPLEPCPLSPEP